MKLDRSKILNEELKVPFREVSWFFAPDYYDGPISGLARFQGRLYRFCCFPDDIPNQNTYVLQELSPEELSEELRIKGKFETCVGMHWSFGPDGRPMGKVAPMGEKMKKFYEDVTIRSHEPWDRPIIAWFNVKE